MPYHGTGMMHTHIVPLVAEPHRTSITKWLASTSSEYAFAMQAAINELEAE